MLHSRRAGCKPEPALLVVAAALGPLRLRPWARSLPSALVRTIMLTGRPLSSSRTEHQLVFRIPMYSEGMLIGEPLHSHSSLLPRTMP
mmetsp:Transcript_148162/g.369399  ORF Transcript_148162/g.369399 Transcript_148162/m.369399 type:complete len:88 (+) Transcript_148162:1002-1265(+)